MLFDNKTIFDEKFEIYRKGSQYYLKIDFKCEDDFGVYSCHIDRIKFDLSLKNIIEESKNTISGVRRNVKVSLSQKQRGYEKILSFEVLENSKGSYIDVELVEEKVHEMTVEDIEKKLGHKIKIVSKQ